MYTCKPSISAVTMATPCELENPIQTDVCKEHVYAGRSNDQRESIFLKGRDCATDESGRNRTQFSKSMPKLSNHLMRGMSAEDEDVISHRASRLMKIRHSGSMALPPAGKFSPASDTAYGSLPRPRSENDFGARKNTSTTRSAYQRRMSDQEDSTCINPGRSIDGFLGRPASVFSVWESLMTTTSTDDIEGKPDY